MTRYKRVAWITMVKKIIRDNIEEKGIKKTNRFNLILKN